MADPVSDMEKDSELWYALSRMWIADSDELAEAFEACLYFEMMTWQ